MRNAARSTALLVLLPALLACQGEPAERAAPQATAAVPETASPEPVPGLVEVTAHDYTFELPDAIPSGWTTFRFANRGHEPHFFMLTLLPEGITVVDYGSQVGAAFGKAWEALRAGGSKADAGAILGREIPAWYAQAKVMGGIGLVVPGETAQTTLRLVPGNYAMECYVKTAEGRFHSELGMLRPLTVTAETSAGVEPTADLDITLANGSIVATGAYTPGRHTVAVHYTEQPPAGLGNDVHLARVEDDTDLAAVASWMDWMNLDGLQTPAPARFLGGAQEMPAGSTAYFEVELAPGHYVWISESPTAIDSLQEFTVPDPES